MRVRFSTCVIGVCVVIGTRSDQEERCFPPLNQLLSLAATKAVHRRTEAAVQQKRHNDSRAPSSRLCASIHGVCACDWCATAGDRTETTLTRPTQRSNTYRRTSNQVYEAYSSSKSSTAAINLCISSERLCIPFSTCDPPGTPSKPHPEGEPCIHPRTYIIRKKKKSNATLKSNPSPPALYLLPRTA